jgi:hypothetical protein
LHSIPVFGVVLILVLYGALCSGCHWEEEAAIIIIILISICKEALPTLRWLGAALCDFYSGHLGFVLFHESSKFLCIIISILHLLPHVWWALLVTLILRKRRKLVHVEGTVQMFQTRMLHIMISSCVLLRPNVDVHFHLGVAAVVGVGLGDGV